MKMSRMGNNGSGGSSNLPFCLCVDVTEQMFFFLAHETMGSRHREPTDNSLPPAAYHHHECERDYFKII